jgi:hypothetical protein
LSKLFLGKRKRQIFWDGGITSLRIGSFSGKWHMHIVRTLVAASRSQLCRYLRASSAATFLSLSLKQYCQVSFPRL